MRIDARVFDDDRLPRDLEHRDQETETLKRAWGRVEAGAAGDEVIIAGPSGVGKTTLARHTLDRLAEATPVQAAYCRALGTTTAGVFRAILQELPAASDPPGNRPADQLRDELVDVVDNPLIVVLDEADDLPDTDVLDRLADVPGLSTCVVTHDLTRWLARLDSQADRYRQAVHLQVDRFGVDQLADILETRAEAGLPPRVVNRGQLERIADDVAGVAREGIQSLRAAAELARERDRATIHESDVDDAYERAERRIREANLQSLPYHHRILYAIIHSAGEIAAADLHDRYDAVAERAYTDVPQTPVGKRSRRNKLAKLLEYGLIERRGEATHPLYAPVDVAVAPDSGVLSPRQGPEL
jgi:Cdc6-like AAA superfamily ATPase